MKVKVDVILVEGIDKQEFVDSFDKETQADWWNMLTEIPNVISMEVEENYLEEFKKDTRIISVDNRMPSFSADTLPSFYQITDTVTASTPATSNNGHDFMGLQFYLNTDIMSSNQTIGAHSADASSTLSNATYFSRWTGKNVDIVTLEGGGSLTLSADHAVQNSHPDFRDPDNPDSSRCVLMNWTDLESEANNQITPGRMFTSHSLGVLSVSGGRYCGFAKKANLRACYDSTEDGNVECINAIVSWHNNKSVNPETGVKNPTILINEYQYLAGRYNAIPIDSVTSIVTESGTITRPGSSWGTDFSSFVSNNIIPFKVRDPDTSNWNWCVTFPYQGTFTSLYTALEAAWDAGIVVVTATGNDSGVYVKTSDSRHYGVYCTTSGTSTLYEPRYGASGVTAVTKTTTTETIWHPFWMYGPAGLDKGIDVAAGQNSETYQILDAYSVRGPGIDIVGLGQGTWSASPDSTFADGNKWGMFSGTSCAAPTVAGIIACLMERYFTYNGVWPSPNRIKSILLNNAKSVIEDATSTTWSNVPSANTDYSVSSFIQITNWVEHIENGFWTPNGGFRIAELAGTTTKRAFLDAQSFPRSQTEGKRPSSGRAYPRPKIKRTS